MGGWRKEHETGDPFRHGALPIAGTYVVTPQENMVSD